MNQSIVERFLDAVQQKDLDGLSALLDAQVSLVQPLTFNGSAIPEVQFDGEDAVLSYLQQVFTHMAQVRFTNPTISVANDNNTVFFEAIGDFVTATSAPYKNVYLFKFELRDSKIFHIAEYANPVTYAITFGVKLG
ncbi:MAG: nuclear transport factor 2 family protein [Stenomitos rutilans HA7619-LM2]|jgi:ketosteroid isomerase-like protein|nr:nuclear transport factor 2 family protein [Stenomitos rutilans HA7619-LM2]